MELLSLHTLLANQLLDGLPGYSVYKALCYKPVNFKPGAPFYMVRCFMALAINVIDRRDPSNEMRHQLQPNKTKVRL